jgi:hypothetical protein
VNRTAGYELDIDKYYDLAGIKEIQYDPEELTFYVLANRY